MAKAWIIVLSIIFLVIVAFAILGFVRVSNNSNPSVSSSSTILSQNQTYFSADAKVMYFYSDYCHWCQKEESEVLPKLGEQGYKLRPMDIATDPNLASQYKIDSTPTFVAENGDRLVGYQEEGNLKAWLDLHK